MSFWQTPKAVGGLTSIGANYLGGYEKKRGIVLTGHYVWGLDFTLPTVSLDVRAPL